MIRPLDLYDFVYGCIEVTGDDIRPRVVPADGWEDLPTSTHAVEALTAYQLRSSALRVIRDGIALREDELQRQGSFNGRHVHNLLSYPQLRSSLHSGATIVIDDIGRWVPHANEICRKIFNARWLYSNCCFYITGPRRAGFPLHADLEHTFVIQIAGTKRWRVAEERSDRLGGVPLSPTAEVSEFVLEPGNVAWIPERFPHMTFSEGDVPSIHMTLGVRRFTSSDLGLDVDADAANASFSEPRELVAALDCRTQLADRALSRSIAITSGMADWDCGLSELAAARSTSLWHVNPGSDCDSIVMLAGVLMKMPRETLLRFSNADDKRVSMRLPWPDYVDFEGRLGSVAPDVLRTLERAHLIPESSRANGL